MSPQLYRGEQHQEDASSPSLYLIIYGSSLISNSRIQFTWTPEDAETIFKVSVGHWVTFGIKSEIFWKDLSENQNYVVHHLMNG